MKCELRSSWMVGKFEGRKVGINLLTFKPLTFLTFFFVLIISFSSLFVAYLHEFRFYGAQQKLLVLLVLQRLLGVLDSL